MGHAFHLSRKQSRASLHSSVSVFTSMSGNCSRSRLFFLVECSCNRKRKGGRNWLNMLDPLRVNVHKHWKCRTVSAKREPASTRLHGFKAVAMFKDSRVLLLEPMGGAKKFSSWLFSWFFIVKDQAVVENNAELNSSMHILPLLSLIT